jgi:hypothetical protein
LGECIDHRVMVELVFEQIEYAVGCLHNGASLLRIAPSDPLTLSPKQ